MSVLRCFTAQDGLRDSVAQSLMIDRHGWGLAGVAFGGLTRPDSAGKARLSTTYSSLDWIPPISKNLNWTRR